MCVFVSVCGFLAWLGFRLVKICFLVSQFWAEADLYL